MKPMKKLSKRYNKWINSYLYLNDPEKEEILSYLFLFTQKRHYYTKNVFKELYKNTHQNEPNIYKQPNEPWRLQTHWGMIEAKEKRHVYKKALSGYLKYSDHPSLISKGRIMGLMVWRKEQMIKTLKTQDHFENFVLLNLFLAHSSIHLLSKFLDIILRKKTPIKTTPKGYILNTYWGDFPADNNVLSINSLIRNATRGYMQKLLNDF